MKHPSQKELLAEIARLKEIIEIGYTTLERLAQKNQLMRDMILDPPNEKKVEIKKDKNMKTCVNCGTHHYGCTCPNCGYRNCDKGGSTCAEQDH